MYLMCEGFLEHFENLNNLRKKCGLKKIPETSCDNISSLRINDDILKFIKDDLGFSVKCEYGFSQYFIISRILHPLLVAPLEPNFDAPINRIAYSIQKNMDYRPGFGSNVIWIFQKQSS